MRKLIALGSILLMTIATACTAHSVIANDKTGFLCAVEGEKLLNPAMSDQAVCAMFKTKVDDALARQTVSIDSPSKAGSAGWVQIRLRFSKPGSASARIVQNAEGKVTNYPELGVDVMDRTMGPKDVERLAMEVAKLFTALKKD